MSFKCVVSFVTWCFPAIAMYNASKGPPLFCGEQPRQTSQGVLRASGHFTVSAAPDFTSIFVMLSSSASATKATPDSSSKQTPYRMRK